MGCSRTGAAAVVFRDPGVGKLYKHDSPYTYFSSKEMHLGEISLECSRPGASAAALWATQKLLSAGEGRGIRARFGGCRKAALDLHQRLEKDARFVTGVSTGAGYCGVRAAGAERE